MPAVFRDLVDQFGCDCLDAASGTLGERDPGELFEPAGNALGPSVKARDGSRGEDRGGAACVLELPGEESLRV